MAKRDFEPVSLSGACVFARAREVRWIVCTFVCAFVSLHAHLPSTCGSSIAYESLSACESPPACEFSTAWSSSAIQAACFEYLRDQSVLCIIAFACAFISFCV